MTKIGVNLTELQQK